jgi:hypothetical protein
MPAAYPSRRRVPPDVLRVLGRKLPAFALIIVWEGGKVDNPEVVADYYEGDDGFVGEMWRWKKRVFPSIPAASKYELWAKKGSDWEMINPDSPVV